MPRKINTPKSKVRAALGGGFIRIQRYRQYKVQIETRPGGERERERERERELYSEISITGGLDSRAVPAHRLRITTLRSACPYTLDGVADYVHGEDFFRTLMKGPPDGTIEPDRDLFRRISQTLTAGF